MRPSTYARICDIVYEQSGIRIKEGKEAMVSARLGRRIRDLGLASDEAYLETLERDLRSEVVQLLDLITTNVTSFFRESEHFEFLSSVYAARLAEGQSRVRFWCAAAATGEEPYTIAMSLREVESRVGRSPDTRLLATDISTRALAFAREGRYEERRTKGIPGALRSKYMAKVAGDPEPSWQAKKELRDLIAFRRLNLSVPPFPMTGPFDVVLCRNVMFYFDDAVRGALLNEIRRLLRPGGYVIVGKSESIKEMRDNYERVTSSIYQKAE